MNFEDEIKKELKGLDDDKQLRQFAWLCGVRALPFLSTKRGVSYWYKSDRQKHLYSIFYALDVTIAFKNDTRATDAAQTAANFAAIYNTAAAKAANAAAYAATDAAKAADYTIMAADSAKKYNFNKIIFEDIELIKGSRLGECNHDIIVYGEIWNNFQRDLKAIGCTYWAKLYEDLFNNGFDTFDKKELERRLSVPESIRSLGAAAVGDYLSPKDISIQEPIPNNLKEKYKNQGLTLILGAGVSNNSGIPLWKDLIEKLLSNTLKKQMEDEKKPYSPSDINEIIKNMGGSLITQTRYIKAVYKDNADYIKAIQTALYENEPAINTDLLNAIAMLCKPQENHSGVRNIITYNFDDLLERTLNDKRIDYKPINKEDDFPDAKKINIYHVHGYLPKDSSDYDNDTSIVFSEEDYHKIYSDVYHWSNIIQLNCFRENTCLFIGCSLSDPNLRRLLDTVKRNAKGLRHYALEKKRTFEQHEIVDFMDKYIQEKSYEELGVNVIWVDGYDDYPKKLSELINPANP